MIEIKGLIKSYGRNRVLTEIDLNIEEEKIYGLLGRNGVGKTTLLKLISGQLISDEIQNMKANNIEISNIPLQKLFVYL